MACLTFTCFIFHNTLPTENTPSAHLPPVTAMKCAGADAEPGLLFTAVTPEQVGVSGGQEVLNQCINL